MPPHNRTLHLIASKLGLGDEDNVLCKAAEFQRLLQAKSTAGSSISDTGIVVICLDLAASLFGADLDAKSVIKYSGLKPSTYKNYKNTVENLLELNDNILTVSLLCVTLQCGEVKDLAQKILDDYCRQAKMEIDLNLPQYVCMAVHQACRLSKVKVSKSKIIEKSRLKPAQWSKLEADWTKFVDGNFNMEKKGRTSKKIEAIDGETAEPMDVDPIKPIDVQSEPEIEPYSVWKKRMLDQAYAELREFEKNEQKTKSPPEVLSRRSPRKTPQKCSPQKSPKKTDGLRLLFPPM